MNRIKCFFGFHHYCFVDQILGFANNYQFNVYECKHCWKLKVNF